MHAHTDSAFLFVNACMRAGSGTVRVLGSAIHSRDVPPTAADRIIDLQGDRLLPGFINAHDHLQLNSFERIEYGRTYRNARQWIADVSAWRARGATFAAGAKQTREQCMLSGALKNLLSGATTVAHHDPLHPWLSRPEFPVAILRDFGWSHSLHIDGRERVSQSYRRTPPDRPWIIHAAEGVDPEAAGELDVLESLGCIGPNTLIVHGLASSAEQQQRLAAAGAALIWCPASNLRLFGRTLNIATLQARRRIGLGTDSRLTGARDLLEELRIARAAAALDEHALEALVTADNARLLRLWDRGTLRPAARADLVVLPCDRPPGTAARADVRLVMLAGRMLYGDAQYAQRMAPDSEWVEVRVDGRSKVLSRALALLLFRKGIAEDGLELPAHFADALLRRSSARAC